MVCWTMSSLYKYIINRSVNEHKHRVGVKDMYTFSSFLRLSVGNTRRLSPKENKGSLQVLQEAIDPLPFCFKLRSGVLLPFLLWRRKTKKREKNHWSPPGFCFYVVVFIVAFFLRQYNWERFLSMFTTLFQTRLISKIIMRKYVTKNSNQKAYALIFIPDV